MKTIKYLSLINYLVRAENKSIREARYVARRLRKLPDELKLALYSVLKGQTPSIEYNSVTFDELVNNEDMSPSQALLMLDWIRREPKAAFRFMQYERLRSPLNFDNNFVVNDQTSSTVKPNHNGLNSFYNTIMEDGNETDIIIND